MANKNKPSKIKSEKQKDKSMVRKDLVEYYKKKISSGNYVAKSNEIADKIVQKIKEQPTRKSGPRTFI